MYKKELFSNRSYIKGVERKGDEPGGSFFWGGGGLEILGGNAGLI